MVSMLLGAAGGRLRLAHREMRSGTGESLGAAIAIVEALKDCLDMTRGGQLAANLFELYDYMLRRLAEAEVERDPAALDEVRSLLETILDGWEAIAPDVESDQDPSRRLGGIRGCGGALSGAPGQF